MMMRKPDEQGRYPLSTDEYQALRTLFGCVNALDDDHKTLKARCELIQGGWRDMRLLTSLSKKLMENLLTTVPSKKLLQISRELHRTICEVKIKPPIGMKSSDSCVYVNEDALLRIISRAMSMNCYLCDKTQKDAKRTCSLYKDIQSLFPYEFDDFDECPLAGASELKKE